MSIESYDPCPCGSGKKLKFCCHAIIGDMVKVAKLQQSHQIRAADQILDKVETRLKPTDPGTGWIGINRATNRISEGQHDEAKKILTQLTKSHPDNLLVVALLATSSFSADSWDKAKPAVQRAFQRCSSSHPHVVSSLAMAIAAKMFGRRQYMASRQYLTFAMRYAPEKDRQDVFVALLEFDSNRQIPYPMRSVHVLEEYKGDAEREKQALRAMKLAGIACYSQAATLYTRLLEEEPDHPVLWLNSGLCQAWDGDEATAAKSLHRAAELRGDLEESIEFESLAQLLEHNDAANSVEIEACRYSVQSISRLLTLLDDCKEVFRTAEDEQSPEISGFFLLFDREFDVQSFDPAQATWQDLPRIVGQLTLVNARDEKPDTAYVSAFAGEQMDLGCQILERVAGDGVGDRERQEKPADGESRSVSRELISLVPQFFVAPGVPASIRETWRNEHWKNGVNEFWLNGPQKCLAGESPLQSAGVPERKMALAAATRVLDAFAEAEGNQVDLPQLCGQLQLEPPQTLNVGPNASLNLFTAAQLHRLPVQELSDQQLAYVLNRALLIHHSHFLYDVLTEVFKRPDCLKNVDLERVYGTMAELCRDRGENEAALEWVQKSKELAQQTDNPFENTLKIELKELMLRLDIPENPGLSELLQRFQTFYFPKVPQLEGYLHELLTSHGVSPETLLGSAMSADGTEAGVWTPGSGDQPEPSEAKKLWIPGQD